MKVTNESEKRADPTELRGLSRITGPTQQSALILNYRTDHRRSVVIELPYEARAGCLRRAFADMSRFPVMSASPNIRPLSRHITADRPSAQNIVSVQSSWGTPGRWTADPTDGGQDELRSAFGSARKRNDHRTEHSELLNGDDHLCVNYL
jgi:hypothetical protein